MSSTSERGESYGPGPHRSNYVVPHLLPRGGPRDLFVYRTDLNLLVGIWDTDL